MKLRHTIRLVLVVGGILTSQLSAGSAQALPSSSPKGLLAFFGGHGSCAIAGRPSEMNAMSQVRELRRDLEARLGGEVALVRTCFAIGSFKAYYDTSRTDAKPSSGTPEDALRHFQGETRFLSEDVPIFIIGQSYGGSMAMLAVTWAAPRQVKGLATLDPISMQQCRIDNFSLTWVGSWFGGDGARGCTRSPRDLEQYHPTIRSLSQYWLNVYQTDYELIHSGPIEVADENVELEVDVGFMQPFGAHGAIDTDDETWRLITGGFLSQL